MFVFQWEGGEFLLMFVLIQILNYEGGVKYPWFYSLSIIYLTNLEFYCQTYFFVC